MYINVLLHTRADTATNIMRFQDIHSIFIGLFKGGYFRLFWTLKNESIETRFRRFLTICEHLF